MCDYLFLIYIWTVKKCFIIAGLAQFKVAVSVVYLLLHSLACTASPVEKIKFYGCNKNFDYVWQKHWSILLVWLTTKSIKIVPSASYIFEYFELNESLVIFVWYLNLWEEISEHRNRLSIWNFFYYSSVLPI